MQPRGPELTTQQVAQLLTSLQTLGVASALLIFLLGSTCIFLWRRHACLQAAFVAELGRHSAERSELLTQHSAQLVSLQMHMLHSFEKQAAPTRLDSASSLASFDGKSKKK